MAADTAMFKSGDSARIRLYIIYASASGGDGCTEVDIRLEEEASDPFWWRGPEIKAVSIPRAGPPGATSDL